ncbi:L-alanine-DL-glutamate epimerase-like enolase superfamily enzyme [Spinactinospora alkalitolerans]|uniref:L-alanine-DL-glutamate epimerase-like enolase superfamily enzyme n=1 Tax=Spinactinospora alkalitolerans TaxID=687207 RepID=A0A852U1M4_9ACTN|nr:enolase C-terminal domain-like protein [Spinactinospora alkalitolerans]NYE47890.1 L-alanine-DL-glutamate epimerase-like enolase superfamily enzyme [Spinactinospora alkalitolerans]
MRITKITHSEAPIASRISNAVIDFSRMTVSIVAVHSDLVVDGEPLVGYGFHSNGRYAQSGLLATRILPRVEEAPPERLLDPETGVVDPVRVQRVAMENEKPGGHGDRAVAVGTLDMAMWDLAAKAAGLPLHRLLHERFGRTAEPASSVWVYAAGGYYHPEKPLQGLRDEIRGYLDLGYRDVKIKIGGAPLEEDLQRIETVLELLPEGSRLAVDANGRFGVEEALRYGRALTDYHLLWYEEPCDPLDYRTHAVLADEYEGTLATGENLFSVPDVRNLRRHGGLRPHRDVLQMDPSLSYGVPEYAGMLDELEAGGWSAERFCPHGGNQINLALAAAFGLGGCESYPQVFEPFGGFADSTPVQDGRVRLPEAPGIGVELKPALHNLLRERL